MPHTPSDIASIAPFLAALNCGAMLIDRDGLILLANQPLASMMKRDISELVGQPLTQFYDADAQAAVRELLHTFDHRGQRESFLPLPDGSKLPVIESARPVAAAPPWNELRIVTLIDISSQKKAESAVRDQYKLVSEMSDTLLQQALELKRYSQTLEARVQQRTAELHEAHMDAVYMLAVASEAKDADTGRHVRRIARLARNVADAMNFSPTESEAIGFSSILHDVGKIHVPDMILTKPGPLDDQERARMQLHTLAGERILSSNAFFDRARKIARSHHEEWDGSGYPDGLAGEQIPLEARIVHLVDVFDALTHSRVYKEAWPYPKAFDAVLAGKGTSFDPQVVEAFERTLEAGTLQPALES